MPWTSRQRVPLPPHRPGAQGASAAEARPYRADSPRQRAGHGTTAFEADGQRNGSRSSGEARSPRLATAAQPVMLLVSTTRSQRRRGVSVVPFTPRRACGCACADSSPSGQWRAGICDSIDWESTSQLEARATRPQQPNFASSPRCFGCTGRIAASTTRCSRRSPAPVPVAGLCMAAAERAASASVMRRRGTRSRAPGTCDGSLHGSGAPRGCAAVRWRAWPHPRLGNRERWPVRVRPGDVWLPRRRHAQPQDLRLQGEAGNGAPRGAIAAVGRREAALAGLPCSGCSLVAVLRAFPKRALPRMHWRCLRGARSRPSRVRPAFCLQVVAPAGADTFAGFVLRQVSPEANCSAERE